MKLVKVTAWHELNPLGGYLVKTDKFYDGLLDEDSEVEFAYRAYEIVDREKVLLNIHYEAYWENGLLQSKGTWIDGQQQGFWQHYNENGTIESRGIKIDNRWIGRWQFYDENGQLHHITDRKWTIL